MTVQINIERVAELAGQGLTTKQIAHCCGFSRATLYSRMKTDSDVLDAVKKGRAMGLQTVTNALFESAVKGNVTAQIFYLKNRDPKRWRDRRIHEQYDTKSKHVPLLPFQFVSPTGRE